MIKPQWLLAAVIGLAASPLLAADSAGTVKRVSGDVQVERGSERLKAAPGMALYVADQVRTGADGAVGITLRDETLLSAGANSLLVLDQFSFDQTTHGGKLQATLKRGKLAVATGKLAKSAPENVEFRTPDSILGVRGTEFALEVAGHGE
ncbi:FecR family protein [Azovibrio restrictus]|uniref:FecR family protein n=1 Tax=Azovibrio restrictus TaxID=146938 RepID=UPI00047E7C29|nr:FecR domain-containing protein [Azovibrio restrictus]